MPSPWAQKTGKKGGEERRRKSCLVPRLGGGSSFSPASSVFLGLATLPLYSSGLLGHSGISGKNKTGHHRSSLPFLPLFPCAYSSVQRRIPPPALSPSSSLIPPLPFLIHAWRGISGGGRTIPLCSRGGEGAGGEGGCQAYSGARICDAIRRRSTCPPRGP